MQVLNADGSEAEMCGNGLRCVVKHLHDTDIALRKSPLAIDTAAGTLHCAVDATHGQADAITVDMGPPRLERHQIPMIETAGASANDRAIAIALEVAGRRLRITAVSMGNPHAIAFVDETGAALRALAESVGPTIEQHHWFPRRTNAEFAHSHDPHTIELVVWERGCGITLACGTGACATAVAACLSGRAQPGHEIRVRLLGGELGITVVPGANRSDYTAVLMRGPATHVYDGVIDAAGLVSATA
jgi:diaminopimelate epimerase